MFTGAFRKLIHNMQGAGFFHCKAMTKKEIEKYVIKVILGITSDIAAREDITALFGEEYEPGTFMIGEIKKTPNFLPIEPTIGYSEWVKSEIRKDIKAIERVLSPTKISDLKLNMTRAGELEEEILKILDLRIENGVRLCDLIPFQECTDVFRRLILLLLVGNPDLEIDTYVELNTTGRDIALSILSGFDNFPILQLLRVSIASGLVGLNLKTSSSAASVIYKNQIVPIDLDKSFAEQIEYIKERLLIKAEEGFSIDFWREYEKEVVNADEGIFLAFFTDDYIETIFDLKLIERQIQFNHNLNVFLIPRALRYGNDASYADVMSLLGEPVFKYLRSEYDSGRFQVCEKGPRAGTLNGLRISQDVADILKKSNYVMVKGARSYEMLQGIRKVAYFGFAVCREISESVTGIDAEKGRLVLIRQSPGMRSFDGFRSRRSRFRVSDKGRKYYLPRFTAEEFYLRSYISHLANTIL